MIVIFMFGRFWHLWRLITARHFRLTFEVRFAFFPFWHPWRLMMRHMFYREHILHTSDYEASEAAASGRRLIEAPLVCRMCSI
jgi:hypothetical protein